MSALLITRGESSTLPSTKKDGKIYITTDTHKIYIDNGTTRFEIDAKYADALKNTLKLVLGGDAAGEISFDGSEGTVTLEVSIDKLSELENAINALPNAGSNGIEIVDKTIKHTNNITAGTAKGSNSKTLTFGGTFTIPSITYDAQGHIQSKSATTMTMPANPNTDTKVTEVGNHYNPEMDSTVTISVDAADTESIVEWDTTNFITGVDVERDAKGHVTGIKVDSVKMLSNPNEDKYVQQGRSTTSDYHTLLLSYKSGATYGEDQGETTNIAYYNEKIAACPETGDIKAPSFTGALNGNATSATRVALSDGSANAEQKIVVCGDTTSGQNLYTVDGVTANYANKSLTATTFIGELNGNAKTATALQTPRKIQIGDTSREFDGSEDLAWTHQNIGASVSTSVTGGTTAGPKITVTVNGDAATVTLPTAGVEASGVMTTENQRFRGVKTLEYPKISSNNTQYQGFYYVNSAGTAVGEHWYDTGDATNITSGKYYWRQYSPNSTPNTSTSGFYETFSLPTVTSGLTANKNYEIFTSKSYSTLDSHCDARYVNVDGDTMTGQLSLNDRLKLWGDSEGGNIRVYLQSSTTNCFEIDGCNADSLRIYYSTDNGVGATGFQQWKFGTNGTFTTGNTITASKESGNISVKAIGANGNIGLHVSTDSGIYDFAQEKWIIATDKARTKVYSEYPIYGAVWNDYAEFRKQNETIKPGYCVTSTKDGKVKLITERMQYCEGIVSDTFGFSIGGTAECKTPLAVSGRVLAYYSGNIDEYEIGDVLCANFDGTVCKMTREEIKEYPDRIVGTVSEIPTYETWGDGNVSTENRIWVKIK